MKKIFLLLGLTSLTFLPITSIALSSCYQESKQTEIRTINFDFNNFSNSFGISLYSNDDIITLLQDKNKDNKDFVDFINLIGIEISQNIKDYEKLSFYNFKNTNVESSEDVSSESKVNLEFFLDYNGIIYNIMIKNVYLFANSIFSPSYLVINNSEQYLNLSQDDLGWASNVLYSEITGSQWRVQINNYFLQQNPNAKNLIIPYFGYIFEKGTLDSQTNIYQLSYIVDPIYKEQISKLPNANEFVDIKINIKISPYAGKELKNSFTLEQNEIINFFNNATFEEISNMKDIQIYDVLKKYVLSFSNIQPLRDCVLVDSTTNNKSINNYNISINEYSNPRTIEISFSSITLPSYNYKFILNFSNQ